MTVREAILSYVDYLEDWDYVRALLAAVEMPVLLCEIAAILDADERNTVPETCMFIRDLALIAPEDIRALFYKELDASPLISALERSIIRGKGRSHECIYTVGKLGLTQCLPTLYKAFDLFYRSDPLMLSGLLMEIRWLGGDDWIFFGQMAASDSYFTRWALLEALDNGVYRSPDAGESLSRTKQYIAPLMKDESILVSQEAAYHFAEIEFYERFTTLSRQEQKAGRRLVEQLKPALDFSLLEIRFHQHLSMQKKDDYTLQELEDFTVELAAAQNA